MKNLLKLFMAMTAIAIISCNKEDAVDTSTENGVNSEITSRTPDFVQVCHLKEDGTFVLKNVPTNALQGHLSHGDFVPDADGDGYTRIGACTGSGDDCDDNNAAIHPGADEICDGIDNDCDGWTDGADDNLIGGTIYYADADGDGYGGPNVHTYTCTQPPGMVPNSGDCNDFDDSIYPGAPEIPNDGIDQNCNGTDSVVIIYPHCDCFSMEELQELYTYTPWPYGWYSDVPGSCKDAPYDQLMEVWLTNLGQPAQNFNFSAQAGTINGNPFASCARFNHLTNQFDKLCGGYTNAQNASNCALILHDFIAQMRSTHPSLDYCILFP